MTLLVGDPVTAVRTFLLAAPNVAAAVGDKVYGGELPPYAVAGMPYGMVLVRGAGGGAIGANDYTGQTDVRVDIFCYGSTPKEGFAVWRAVRGAMRQMRRTLENDVLLHWAKESGGPNTLREQDTEWPLTLSTWQIMWSEMEETA